MKVFESVVSQVIPLDMDNVDTDMIIPAQYLTKTDKKGYSEHLFQRLREQEPSFIFNNPAYKHAEILLTKLNFGCGSSREHAVWSIIQSGIRVVIAKSFSDIFYNNAAKNGLLLITLNPSIIDLLMIKANQQPLNLIIDLIRQRVSTEEGVTYYFDFDLFRQECFLKGQDDLDYLLEATR